MQIPGSITNRYNDLVVTIKKVVDRLRVVLYDSNGNELGTTDNPLVVEGDGSGGSLLADVNISDAAGNALTSTAGSLDVHEDNSATIATLLLSLDNKTTICDTDDIFGSVIITDSTSNLDINIDGSINAVVTATALPTGAATSANQTTEIGHLSTIAGDTTSLDGKVTKCDTDDITVTALALPTGAATSDNQTNKTQMVQITDGTNEADVIATNGHYGVVTLSPGHISTENSTSTPLDADEEYEGTSEDITNYGVIVVSVESDVASATGGLCVEFSTDNTNWFCADEYTILAATNKSFSFQPQAKYFRIRYTNSDEDQTYFRLQTAFKPYYVKPSSHRVGDIISSDDDAELVKAVLTAEKPHGDFTPINATNGGNLKFSLEEIEGDISSNSNKQLNVTLFDSDGLELDMDVAGGVHVQTTGNAETSGSVTCTSADTEYSFTVPANAIFYEFSADNPIRFSRAINKVVPNTDSVYPVYTGEMYYNDHDVNYSRTIYVASSVAGTIVNYFITYRS